MHWKKHRDESLSLDFALHFGEEIWIRNPIAIASFLSIYRCCFFIARVERLLTFALADDDSYSVNWRISSSHAHSFAFWWEKIGSSKPFVLAWSQQRFDNAKNCPKRAILLTDLRAERVIGENRSTLQLLCGWNHGGICSSVLLASSNPSQPHWVLWEHFFSMTTLVHGGFDSIRGSLSAIRQRDWIIRHLLRSLFEMANSSGKYLIHLWFPHPDPDYSKPRTLLFCSVVYSVWSSLRYNQTVMYALNLAVNVLDSRERWSNHSCVWRRFNALAIH